MSSSFIVFMETNYSFFFSFNTVFFCMSVIMTGCIHSQLQLVSLFIYLNLMLFFPPGGKIRSPCAEELHFYAKEFVLIKYEYTVFNYKGDNFSHYSHP